MKNKNEFLEDLASLCDKYGATFSYSNDDSGVEAHINGLDRDLVELGFLDMWNAGEDIRQLKDKLIEHRKPLDSKASKGQLVSGSILKDLMGEQE